MLAIGIYGAFQAYAASRINWEASMASTDPKFATSTDPSVRIMAVIAARQVGRPLMESVKGRTDDAKAALRTSPLDAQALTVLAITGETAAGGSLLTLAEQVTRRSDFVELVALDEAAKKQDLDGALSHIDRLLTIYPDTQVTIFPALVAALSDPQAPDLLIKRKSRPWFVPFLGFAISNSSEIATSLAMVEKASLTSKPDDGLLNAVVSRLTKEGAVREAQAFAIRYAHVSPDDLTDFSLTTETLDQRLVPLTWKTAPDVTSSDLVNTKVSLEFPIPPLRTIDLLDRQTGLTPGSYVLEQSVSSGSGSPPSSVSWSMTCIGQAQPAWQQEVPITSAKMRFKSRIAIPQGCLGQAWKLSASGENLQIASSVNLEDIRLSKSEEHAAGR